MMKRPNEPDTLTLSGNQIDRIQQTLDVARHQIRLGQHETDNAQVEGALLDAEEADDTARARVADAVEAIRQDEEEAGQSEQKRQACRPIYRSV